MSRVAFYTLGCKVNQYETDAMTELLRRPAMKLQIFTSRRTFILLIHAQ